MLRAVLLASPFVLSVVISCGDSSPTFDDSNLNPDVGGADTGQSGATAGGTTSNQGGSMTSAGNNNAAGTKGNGGNGNTAGSGNTAGNGNTAGSGTAGTKGNGGSGNPGGGTTGNGGSMPNAGAPTDPMAGAPGAAGMPGAAGAPNPPQCPDVFGAYDVVDTNGMCDGFGKNAPQLIQGTDVACFAHFVSIPISGNGAVNGGAALDESGDFSGAKLFFGNKERMPCSGVWNQAEERMTVKCGGAADQCTVVLDRQ